MTFAEPPAGERWTLYRASPEVGEVTLDVRRVPRTVTANAALTVRPEGGGLSVTERIDYDVEHGTLSELRVRVPTGVREVRFSDGAGAPLEPTTADGVTTLRLGRAATGAVSLSAEYRVDAADRPEVSVPVIEPLDAAPKSAELRFAQGLDAAVESDRWTRRRPADAGDGSLWTADRLAGPIPLRFAAQKNPATSAGARVLLRSAVSREGAVTTVADCRLDSPPRRLAVRFAPGVSPRRFFWGGRPVAAEQTPDGTYELDLGANPSAGVLRIETDAEAADLSGLAARVSLAGFEFVGPGASAVRETLWRVSLPESQHLFVPPKGYDPRYHWTLSRGMWTRKTDDAFETPAEWLGADPAPVSSDFDAGHVYAFSRPGPPERLSLTAISRSLVVLLGAGAAIVIGYAFAHGFVPRPRAALAALLSALLLLWAFFPGQVQIFLQPAAFGLLLVAVAAFAERLLRGSQEPTPPVEGPRSAVDFVTILPGESSTSAPPPAIGSEEPTVLRHGRPAPEPVGAHGEPSS
jgi:hypothetical protein